MSTTHQVPQFPAAPHYGTITPQPYGQQTPNIIVNNSASASINSLGLRRRRSMLVHTVLFLTTGGIGNVLYMMFFRGRIR